MKLFRMIAKWWRDIWAEPMSLGPKYDTEGIIPVHPNCRCVHSEDHSGEMPLHAVPRVWRLAPAWVVGKDGPNVAADPDHYTKIRAEMCDLDWDVLLDACNHPLPSTRQVLRGAAYNESAKYLQRCLYFTPGWAPTEEGRKAADAEFLRRRNQA